MKKKGEKEICVESKKEANFIHIYGTENETLREKDD